MLSSVFGLLVALGILVTIHEYGHFWVARRCGVKVLRFSVGFGQPIWRKYDRHGTEFALSWIPLGGYVKMLDEREGEVSEEDRPYAFTSKPPWQKILIALAGPLANLLFAIFAFMLMFMIGIQDLSTLVDQPTVDTPADIAGLQRGDRIVKVDGESVSSFSELGLALASRVGDSGTIELQVSRAGALRTLPVKITNWLATAQTPEPLASLGIRPQLPERPALIDHVEAGGAASVAGLQANDMVTAVDGRSVDSWSQWVDIIRQNPDKPMRLAVERAGQTIQITLTPGEKQLDDGSTIGYVGAATTPFSWPEDQLVLARYAPWTALVKGWDKTQEMVVLSYQMLWKMVTGKVSFRQVGGPISMAQMAGVSVQSGIEAFIGFLAFISVSLAIVNLLPVPVLDGGHVVLHSAEWLLRKPLPERVQMIGMQIGMFFVLSLMCLAFVNDIGRLFN